VISKPAKAVIKVRPYEVNYALYAVIAVLIIAAAVYYLRRRRR
jgi:LPXTG-motif cell wall-anchored protein